SAGGSAGAAIAGAGVDFAMQVPSRNSCQGKHLPSSGRHTPSFSTSPGWHDGAVSWSDCAIAATGLKSNQQIEIAAAAEKRVMIDPSAIPKMKTKIVGTTAAPQYVRRLPFSRATTAKVAAGPVFGRI